MSPNLNYRYDCSLSTSFSSKSRANFPCTLFPRYLSFAFSAPMPFICLVLFYNSLLRILAVSFHKHYCHLNIVWFVKARRISWVGHVKRMEDSRVPKRVMREKIYTRRKRGRPKVRWLDDVQVDLREMGIEGWRRKAQDRGE
jgi:hypothetical protein